MCLIRVYTFAIPSAPFDKFLYGKTFYLTFRVITYPKIEEFSVFHQLARIPSVPKIFIIYIFDNIFDNWPSSTVHTYRCCKYLLGRGHIFLTGHRTANLKSMDNSINQSNNQTTNTDCCQEQTQSCVFKLPWIKHELLIDLINQRTIGPVNAHWFAYFYPSISFMES